MFYSVCMFVTRRNLTVNASQGTQAVGSSKEGETLITANCGACQEPCVPPTTSTHACFINFFSPPVHLEFHLQLGKSLKRSFYFSPSVLLVGDCPFNFNCDGVRLSRSKMSCCCNSEIHFPTTTETQKISMISAGHVFQHLLLHHLRGRKNVHGKLLIKLFTIHRKSPTCSLPAYCAKSDSHKAVGHGGR